MKSKIQIAMKLLDTKKMPGPGKLTGWIAIFGFSIGCIAMIISMSILNGFEEQVKNKIIGFEGDLRILGTKEWKNDLNAINRIDGVLNVISFKERRGVIITNKGQRAMLKFKSIDFDSAASFYDFDMFDFSNNSSLPKIAIGEVTAQKLNISEGDIVKIMSPLDQNLSFGIPRIQPCIVGKIYKIQVLDLDDKIVFIPKEIGDKLFIRKKIPDGFDLRIIKSREMEIVKFISAIMPHAQIFSWKDIHRNLFDAMRLEKIGAFFVLLLIIIVACLNLVTTLILIIAQKLKQFGVLKALGANNDYLKKIILNQGVIIGGFSTFIGLLIGLSIILIQNIFGIVKLPKDIYFISELPMIIYLSDIIFICFSIFSMIIIASMIAVRKISNIKLLQIL